VTLTRAAVLHPHWRLETDRVLLRPFEEDDLDAFHAIHSDAGGRTEARNVAFARVLEKLGMRREAHFVENEWVKSAWQCELVYAMLASEWAA
jgi:RimJ/RimL family protein N-acetyltransferase